MAIMIPLRYVMCVLSVWTVECATSCGDRERESDGRCCDMCPPGTFRKGLCSEHHQTACSPCQQGYFSDKYHIFDRCEECQSCQQEYAEKCTLTRNANCSCHAGFLCSNNICSHCVENTCVTGETPKRRETPSGDDLIEYSFQCERLPDPINGLDSTHMILGIGFVLLSLTILVLLSYACMKNLRKHTAYKNPINIPADNTNTSDFHLSKEESGLTFMIHDESKISDCFCPMQPEEVVAFGLTEHNLSVQPQALS